MRIDAFTYPNKFSKIHNRHIYEKINQRRTKTN